jgi:hypothetical protein
MQPHYLPSGGGKVDQGAAARFDGDGNRWQILHRSEFHRCQSAADDDEPLTPGSPVVVVVAAADEADEEAKDPRTLPSSAGQNTSGLKPAGSTRVGVGDGDPHRVLPQHDVDRGQSAVDDDEPLTPGPPVIVAAEDEAEEEEKESRTLRSSAEKNTSGSKAAGMQTSNCKDFASA